MTEEMKQPETMDDFAQELEASFSNFRDDDVAVWDKLVQMKEDKTEFEVTVEGVVKGGVIAYVEGIRAFIPVSKLSLEYVEDTEVFLKKTLLVRVFEVKEEDNQLILSAREILREKSDAQKKEQIEGIKVGTVLEGTVDSLQTYGAFVRLENGISGLVHVSQISQKRIKSPKDVLSMGDTVTVKVIKNEGGKLSLSIKALQEVPEDSQDMEVFDLPKAADVTTSLGSLFKNIKLD